jgi:hypothetical protein
MLVDVGITLVGIGCLAIALEGAGTALTLFVLAFFIIRAS